MHPRKSLNVMGDGGIVATNKLKLYNGYWNIEIMEWLIEIRLTFGVNMRLQPLQAIVALEGLKKLKNNTRNKNAKYLDKELKSLYPNIIYLKEKKLFGNICFVYGEVQK